MRVGGWGVGDGVEGAVERVIGDGILEGYIGIMGAMGVYLCFLSTTAVRIREIKNKFGRKISVPGVV